MIISRFCFEAFSASVFGVCSVYFSCVMVRLLLLSSPALCMLAGVGLSDLLRYLVNEVKNYKEELYDTDLTEEEIYKKNQEQLKRIGGKHLLNEAPGKVHVGYSKEMGAMYVSQGRTSVELRKADIENIIKMYKKVKKDLD